jgi:hypothetical protein
MTMAVSALLAGVVVAACSGAAAGNPAGRHDHRPGNRSAHIIAVLDDTANRALAGINVPGEIIGIAGLLANPRSSVGAPMTTDGGTWVRAGRYVLAFDCTGTGQIEAAIWIGNARAHVRAACQRQPVPVRLYLTASRAGSLFMQFAAEQRETVAVAGWAGRLSRG